MGKNLEVIPSQMCEGINTAEDMKKLCQNLQDQIVNQIKAKYKEEILKGKSVSDNPTIYIIGGQNASGKSRLITELGKINNNTVSIIIDDMKEHHPFRNYIDKNFPEESEELLHLSCFEVFDTLLDELLQEGYDIVIERTLGSKEKAEKYIVPPANQGYNIDINVTGTHGINSILSALERFVVECQLKDEYLRTNSNLKIDPRPISPKHHDDTYNNIISVLEYAESGKFKDNKGNPIFPKISVWDRTPGKPTKIYKSDDMRYHNSREAMEAARQRDLNRCKSATEYGVVQRISNIKLDLENAKPGDTLDEYRDFCMMFLQLIEERAAEYMCEKVPIA